MEDVLDNTTTNFEDDVLSTPELAPPPVVPDAHRGYIKALTPITFESGTTAVKIELVSTDTGVEAEYLIFPPQAFVDNIKVDPNTLSDVPPPGKKMTEKNKYSRVVASTTKDAEFQQLRKIAHDAGRSLSSDQKPEDFNGYIELMNELLNGVEVVFTRNVDNSSDDVRFQNRLRVNRILPLSVVDNPKFGTKGRTKYRKAWESEE